MAKSSSIGNNKFITTSIHIPAKLVSYMRIILQEGWMCNSRSEFIRQAILYYMFIDGQPRPKPDEEMTIITVVITPQVHRYTRNQNDRIGDAQSHWISGAIEAFIRDVVSPLRVKLAAKVHQVQ